MKIGIDGGGTKTELILMVASGQVLARQLTSGSNPSICGPDEARRTVEDALKALTRGINPSNVTLTLLCMAGSQSFWQETAAGLSGYGKVLTTDDSLPVLELATGGEPGLVLHGGTGSFVAARTERGSGDDILNAHYAGGLGWRFGDPGSGYDLGRRAIARALLELQGYRPASGLSTALQTYIGLDDAAAISRFLYAHAEPNKIVAALAPAVLDLAADGEASAREIVAASTGELIDIAQAVALSLFPGQAPAFLRAGLSGPILTHPAALAALTPHSTFNFTPVTPPPIEGVQQLLARLTA